MLGKGARVDRRSERAVSRKGDSDPKRISLRSRVEPDGLCHDA